MTDHGRKYGEQESRPIPLWNGVFEHYARIGDAIWEFAWCIDKITEEHDGVGLVLGGAPVKIGTIVRALKGSRRESVRRHMMELEAERYIRRRRTPYGCVIEVLNSLKFGIWKRVEKPKTHTSPALEKPKIDVSLPLEKPTGGCLIPKNVVSKEDTAVDAAIRVAAEEAAAWRAIGSNKLGIPRFRAKWEFLFAHRNGNSIADAMERCIVSCQEAGIPVPKPFYDAKRVVERREAEEVKSLTDSERPELEDLPWAKR